MVLDLHVKASHDSFHQVAVKATRWWGGEDDPQVIGSLGPGGIRLLAGAGDQPENEANNHYQSNKDGNQDKASCQRADHGHRRKVIEWRRHGGCSLGWWHKSTSIVGA